MKFRNMVSIRIFSDTILASSRQLLSRCNVLERVALSNCAMEQKSELNSTEWNPSDIFHDTCCEYAVIVLDRPIQWKHDVLLRIWQRAHITVTVDGGTHRWMKYLEEQGIKLLNGEHRQYVPDLITGDMDSCSVIVVEKLISMGSTVVETPDQSHTDYTKALMQIAQYAKRKNINLDVIYVLAETSGRFDHIIGNINTLYKSDKLVGNTKVIQVASNSLTWLLKPGLHNIRIPEILVRGQSWCGLLPFGSSVNHVSTTGLKWNLNDTTMHFGGLVSTSNTYNKTEVTVNTDTSIIWTMGIELLREAINNEAT
ncbi:thiamine pyrophosphokinase 1 isoform X2 [Linepithema humile]|uniref:thiamine pyrophosphokinase 1 isoform X2 n=1 Tax=Linepithema humile TaxID=83485 RepID=UPI00351EB1A8